MKHQQPSVLRIISNLFCRDYSDLRFAISRFSYLASALLLIACLIPFAAVAEAAFTGHFSLLAGEEYNDNIFFVKEKEHDFVTVISPTFSLLYALPGQTEPVFRAHLTPTGQLFARHSELNNFGRNLTFGTRYTYFYSPRLTFGVADTLRYRGETRTVGPGEQETSSLAHVPTAPPPTEGIEPLPLSQRLGDFLSTRDTLTNHFAAQGSFLYAPEVRFIGLYSFDYTTFLDEGGMETSHSLEVRGVYRWRQEHNLRAGYRVEMIRSRNGEENFIHSFGIGDDYLSRTQIQLTPTLTISASTGISLNVSGDGPRVRNNSSVVVTKVWETAALSTGVRTGLASTFGVTGIADRTSLFAEYDVRLTERLTGNANVDYSLYDSDRVNFNALEASAGLRYGFTPWLCSGFRYTHRRLDSGSGARNTDLLSRGIVYSNSAFLVFSAHFDVWPSVRLAQTPSCQLDLPQPTRARSH